MLKEFEAVEPHHARRLHQRCAPWATTATDNIACVVLEVNPEALTETHQHCIKKAAPTGMQGVAALAGALPGLMRLMGPIGPTGCSKEAALEFTQ